MSAAERNSEVPGAGFNESEVDWRNMFKEGATVGWVSHSSHASQPRVDPDRSLPPNQHPDPA